MLKYLIFTIFTLWATCLQAQTENMVVERTQVPILPEEPLYAVFTQGKLTIMNQKAQKLYSLGDNCMVWNGQKVGLLRFNQKGYLAVYKYDGNTRDFHYFVISRQGEVVYTFQPYLEVKDWRADFFTLSSGRYLSLWSADLQQLTPPKYSHIYKFSDSLARVDILERLYDYEFQTKYGYINMKGEEIIPVKYRNYYKDAKTYLDDTAINFSEKKAPFIDDSTKKIGFFNTQGKVVIPPKYESAYGFQKGKALVFESCNYWYINEKGGILSEGSKPPSIYERYETPNPTTGVVYDKAANRFGYKNTQKEWVIKPKYYSIKKEENYLVCRNNITSYDIAQIHLTDTLGNMIWQGSARDIMIDNNGYFWVLKSFDNQYIFCNPQGKILWQSDCKDYNHFFVESLLSCPTEDVQHINLRQDIDHDLTVPIIEKVFKRPFAPKTLELSHDSLQKIPERVYKMTDLESLSIQHTKIQSLSGKLANLKKLTVLNIENNKFNALPKILYKMPQLKELYTRGNPIPFQEIIKLQKTFPQLKIYYR